MAFFDEFRHIKIQLEGIKSATKNFSDDNLIGKGGFGKVYKGEISHSKGKSVAAFKRLDSRFGQGNAEFWREIMMLSRYTHENLVSLLGYCDEGDEMILVYEHATRGSLDQYLGAATLTWTQRLKICLGVARGLSYLHEPTETHQRVLHRDIKSANILLDEKWNAKVSDLGLSKLGPANQHHTVLVSNVVGTLGYCDPMYMEMGFLTKESDVYSFGVVLFEVLCGRLCFEVSKNGFEILVPMWKQRYEQNKLAEIIFRDLVQNMDPCSLQKFSAIAYQCLKRSREERPRMADVVKVLETALQLQDTYELEVELALQEIHEGWELPKDYEDVITTAVPPLQYGSKAQLKRLLSKGFLVNDGKTWISLNKKGQYIEMISAAKCFPGDAKAPGDLYSTKETSRFANGGLRIYNYTEAHVKTQFLSPGITYVVNFVFRLLYTSTPNLSKQMYLPLRYRLKGEAKCSISYLAHERENGWMVLELYQFTSDKRNFELEFFIEGTEYGNSPIVEGIEFRPLEKVEDGALVDENVDMKLISDSDIDYEQLMPDDHEEIIKWSKDSVQWTTKKELYFLLCNGFLINEGKEWLSLAKNGKKCHMLSARVVLQRKSWKWRSLLESRFGEVYVAVSNPYPNICVVCKMESHKLSTQTTYALYLVYKFPESHSSFERPVRVTNRGYVAKGSYESWYFYLLYHQTPVVGPKVDENAHNRLNRPKIKGHPQLRDDGWMEVQIYEFYTHATTGGCSSYSMDINLELFCSDPLDELIVQGFEYKPI